MTKSTTMATASYQTVEPDGSVTIPPELLRECGLSVGDAVTIDDVDGVIIIRRTDSVAT